MENDLARCIQVLQIKYLVRTARPVATLQNVYLTPKISKLSVSTLESNSSW